MGSREIVVKPVGPQLSSLRGISGATIMGDGGVVLILDLAVLVRLAAVQSDEDVIALTPEPVQEVQTKHVVMVVDDSITVRKVTSRLLERNGFEVIQAKDGVDALAQLQETIPDVMLLDVEMPRMDGFELATNMRNDNRTMDVPIIMITSRTGQKHRDRAKDLGVNIYMGKPYNDTTLLENIGSLIDK
jgi:chemosensory pili system protein ChpA (sensor histidine kinase/response regulator)